MRRALVLCALVATAPTPAPAQPGAAAQATELLIASNDALAAGDHAGAATLAERARRVAPDRAARAEANRVLGVSRFALGERAAAEAAFVEYLVLDVDGHLDPALVPPETVVFFEDIRARHAAELGARRPRPPRKRYAYLAPVPIYGQIQNGDTTKAWLIGGSAAALLAVNLGTYFWLRAHCRRDDGTCYSGPESPLEAGHEDLTDKARTIQGFNLLSGAAIAGVAIYAAVDGVLGYRADSAAEARALEVSVVATDQGGTIGLVGRF